MLNYSLLQGDLGRQLAIEYARHGGPERIYIADLPRENAGEALVQSIQEASASSVSIVFLEIDLASLSSVQQAAARFMALESRLGLCILNAGVVLMDPGTTDDGESSDRAKGPFTQVNLQYLQVMKLRSASVSSAMHF